MKKRFEGIITKFAFYELTEAQKNITANIPGKGVIKVNENKTHNMVMYDADGNTYQWGSVNFRPNDDMVFRRDCGDGWINIYDGANVFFFYNEKINGQYTNRNVDKKSFQLMENGVPGGSLYKYQGESAAPPTNQQTVKKTPYDSKGPAKGNAHNNSLILVNYDLSNPEKIDAFAREIYNINQRIQERGYTNGYAIGMAVNNAVMITKDITKVEAMAIHLLETHIKTIEKYVETGEVPKVESPTPTNIDDDIPF